MPFIASSLWPSSLYGAARCTYECGPEDMSSSSQAVKVKFFSLYEPVYENFTEVQKLSSITS